MPIKTTKWVLFAILVATIPVPFYLINVGWIPSARILLLAVHCLVFIAQEGLGGKGPVLVFMISTQAIVYLLVIYFFCSSIVQMTEKWPSRIRGSIVGIFGLSLLIIVSSFDVYRPLHLPNALETSFFHIYD